MRERETLIETQIETARTPLHVTCIMPTSGARRRYLARALADFLAQDYAARDLLIVDEPHGAAPLVATDARVEIVTLDSARALTIGAKRNLAVSLARGDVVCHWDDDDWSAPQRLSKQIAPIAAGHADVTGLPLEDVVTLHDGRRYRASAALAREIFALGVHGGTIMYRRALWTERTAFRNVNSGEDGAFVRALLADGARLVSVPNDGTYIYVRHDSRWPLDERQYAHAHEWREVFA